MTRVLFVCSQNKLRSPTAEQVFSNREGFEVASAGTDRSAGTPISAEAIGWADVIFVMERVHRSRISKQFRAHLKNKRISASTYLTILNIWILHSFVYLRRRSGPSFRVSEPPPNNSMEGTREV
jgi:predicted protein tyrosine phosphatase